MKNRTIIGIICLILAILVTFVVAPLINRLAEDTEEVVIILQDIKQGAEITESMVKLTSFIGCGMTDLPGMLLGGLFVFGMMLVVSLMGKESCIGGADIKLGGACAFALGIHGGIAGLITGLVLAVVINLLKGKNTRQQSFPLVPYLSAGFLAAYFI